MGKFDYLYKGMNKQAGTLVNINEVLTNSINQDKLHLFELLAKYNGDEDAVNSVLAYEYPGRGITVDSIRNSAPAQAPAAAAAGKSVYDTGEPAAVMETPQQIRSRLKNERNLAEASAYADPNEAPSEVVNAGTNVPRDESLPADHMPARNPKLEALYSKLTGKQDEYVNQLTEKTKPAAGKPGPYKANVPGGYKEPAAEQKATAGNSLIDKYLPTALKYAPQAAAGMAGFGGIYALLSMLPGAKRRRMLNVLASLVGGAGLAYGADKYLKGRNGTLA